LQAIFANKERETLPTWKPIYHVLSVEDSACDRRLIQEFLVSTKVTCLLHFVEDGQQAVDFLTHVSPFEDTPRPDLILLDLNLPKVDGREVLRFVKGDPLLRQIPVIVFSTSNSESDVLASYQLYANAYFAKPNDLDGFVEIIQKIEAHWLQGAEIPSRRALHNLA
jgi:two-component system, chemotaxis family, response regulator Rcp1